MATGKPTKLPLLSPPALWRYERSKSAAAAAIAANTAALAHAAASVSSSTASSVAPVTNGAGFWLTALTAPRAFLVRQRQGLRRFKRRVASAGADSHGTPLGAGGARVRWLLPPPPPTPRSKRSGSRMGAGGSVLTPVGRGKSIHPGSAGVSLEKLAPGKVAPGSGAAAGVSPAAAAAVAEAGKDGGVAGGQNVGAGASNPSGVVGYVWVSLKLRDPSMLLMRVVRQWNMARDEASVQQRRAAQLEAKR